VFAEYSELHQRIVSPRRKTFISRALNSSTRRKTKYIWDVESVKGNDKMSSLELVFVQVFRKNSHDATQWVRKSLGISPPTV